MISDMALRAIYTALRSAGTRYKFKTASTFYKEYIRLETELQNNLSKYPHELHDGVIQDNYDVRVAAVKGLYFNSPQAFDTVYKTSAAQMARKLRGKYSRERSLELADEVVFIIKRLMCR